MQNQSIKQINRINPNPNVYGGLTCRTYKPSRTGGAIKLPSIIKLFVKKKERERKEKRCNKINFDLINVYRALNDNDDDIII